MLPLTVKAQKGQFDEISRLICEEANCDSALKVCYSIIENKAVIDYWRRQAEGIANLVQNYSDYEAKPLQLYFEARKIHKIWKEDLEKVNEDVHRLVKMEGDFYRKLLTRYPECKLAPFVRCLLAQHCTRQINIAGRLRYMNARAAAKEAEGMWRAAASSSEAAVFPIGDWDYEMGSRIAPIAQLHLAWCYDPYFYKEYHLTPDAERALEEYQGLVNRHPNAVDKNGRKLILNAYVSMLIVCKNMGDTIRVREICDTLVNGFPNQEYEIYGGVFGEIHPQAYLMLAECDRSEDKSMELYEKIIREFPEAWAGKSCSGAIALYSVGALSRLIDMFDDPLLRIGKCQEVVDANPHKPIGGYAQWTIAQIYERDMNDLERALVEYRKVIANFGDVSLNGEPFTIGENARHRMKNIEAKLGKE